MNRAKETRNLAAILALACIAISAGCTVLGLSNNDDRDRLNEARRAWNAQHITDYSFTYRALCFCPQSVTDSVRILVKSDTIVSVTYIATGQRADAQGRGLFRTIPGLFDILDEALDRKADSFDVQYDPTHHFPASANIDYITNAADEELGFHITSFAPINP